MDGGRRLAVVDKPGRVRIVGDAAVGTSRRRVVERGDEALSCPLFVAAVFLRQRGERLLLRSDGGGSGGLGFAVAICARRERRQQGKPDDGNGQMLLHVSSIMVVAMSFPLSRGRRYRDHQMFVRIFSNGLPAPTHLQGLA